MRSARPVQYLFDLSQQADAVGILDCYFTHGTRSIFVEICPGWFDLIGVINTRGAVHPISIVYYIIMFSKLVIHSI